MDVQNQLTKVVGIIDELGLVSSLPERTVDAVVRVTLSCTLARDRHSGTEVQRTAYVCILVSLKDQVVFE